MSSLFQIEYRVRWTDSWVSSKNVNAAALIDFYKKTRGKREVALLGSDQSFVDEHEIPSMDELSEADQSCAQEQDDQTSTSTLPDSHPDLARMFVCPGCRNDYETHRKLMLHLNNWKRSLTKNGATKPSHGFAWNPSDVQNMIDEIKIQKKLFY